MSHDNPRLGLTIGLTLRGLAASAMKFTVVIVELRYLPRGDPGGFAEKPET
jgi:hypothetical protein